MSISQQSVGTSATAIYTSSGSSAATVVYLTNTDTSSVVVQVYIVQSGGTAGTANIIKKDLAIAAADTYIIDSERLIFDDGDSIQVSASTGSVVTATVSFIGV